MCRGNHPNPHFICPDLFFPLCPSCTPIIPESLQMTRVPSTSFLAVGGGPITPDRAKHTDASALLESACLDLPSCSVRRQVGTLAVLVPLFPSPWFLVNQFSSWVIANHKAEGIRCLQSTLRAGEGDNNSIRTPPKSG